MIADNLFRRKATVNDRIQAARKGRGAVLGGESDENEDSDNLPGISFLSLM